MLPPAPVTTRPPGSGASALDGPGQDSPLGTAPRLACPSVHLCLPTAGEGWQWPGTEPGPAERQDTEEKGERRQRGKEDPGRQQHAVQGWRWASAPDASGSLSDRSRGALPVGWSYCRSLVRAKDRYFSCLHLPAKNRTLGKTEPILFVPASYGKSQYFCQRRNKTFSFNDRWPTSPRSREQITYETNKINGETKRELSPGIVLTIELSP